MTALMVGNTSKNRKAGVLKERSDSSIKLFLAQEAIMKLGKYKSGRYEELAGLRINEFLEVNVFYYLLIN